MTIRPLGAADLDAVTALEARAHGAWSRQDIAAEFDRDDAVVLGAPALEGFAVVRRIADEAWLLEIAVDPAHRRAGHARALIDKALDQARAWGVSSLWLEVRAGNAAARALYAACGFAQQGTRPGYYRGGEDAVLLRRLTGPAAPRAG